ncbi:hypothetical protein Tsubulata_029160 [Turnera subulata]|uniref:NHL domain-containing protein n=1 Tax=Turnera subulata TaxID=218843 RepID=A0A9Q0FW14_9ROSI|nr:hypothetical protein Tsubulata_029160 [Turnera subulata]
MASSLFLLTSFFFLFLLPDLPSSYGAASSQPILEDGYTVTTVINGHKLGINPHALLPLPGSSDFILLDSVNSVFYTLPFPSSPEVAVKRFSGGEPEGYTDGEPGSARFNKPKSFAVDQKGNVYVADKVNFAIRKISSSGVTTIAGGLSKKTGKEDGPGKNATFSNDFELIFVAERCALLVSDHGSQLVRQIALKPEDCGGGPKSGPALGAVQLWILGLGLSCVFGIAVGIAIRPYIIMPHEGFKPLHFCSKIWKQYLCCLTIPVRQVLTNCFDIRNEVASSALCALLRRLFWLSMSHLSLMVRVNAVGSQNSSKYVSLMDSDVNTSTKVEKSGMFEDQVKELISFDMDPNVKLSNTNDEIVKQGEGNQQESDVLLDGHGRLNEMILANMTSFAKETHQTSAYVPLVESLGLVKRR